MQEIRERQVRERKERQDKESRETLRNIKSIGDCLSVVNSSEELQELIRGSKIGLEFYTNQEKVDLILPGIGPLDFARAITVQQGDTTKKFLTYALAKKGERLPNNPNINCDIRDTNPKAYHELLEVVLDEFSKQGYETKQSFWMNL